MQKIQPRPFAVGLTGSIGSGKSTVGSIFQKRGAVVVDADQLARDVVAPGTIGLEQIKQEFGDQYLEEDGTLDRKKLGQFVFANPAGKAQLEAIVHPLVRSLAAEAYATCPPEKLFVYMVPLLFESGKTPEFLDSIVTVTCPKEVAIQRIVARDGCSPELALKKWESQLPQEQKAMLSDHVIPNGGTREEVTLYADRVFDLLMREMQGRL